MWNITQFHADRDRISFVGKVSVMTAGTVNTSEQLNNAKIVNTQISEQFINIPNIPSLEEWNIPSFSKTIDNQIPEQSIIIYNIIIDIYSHIINNPKLIFVLSSLFFTLFALSLAYLTYFKYCVLNRIPDPEKKRDKFYKKLGFQTHVNETWSNEVARPIISKA
jgi:hypothetical protein